MNYCESGQQGKQGCPCQHLGPPPHSLIMKNNKAKTEIEVLNDELSRDVAISMRQIKEGKFTILKSAKEIEEHFKNL